MRLDASVETSSIFHEFVRWIWDAPRSDAKHFTSKPRGESSSFYEWIIPVDFMNESADVRRLLVRSAFAGSAPLLIGLLCCVVITVSKPLSFSSPCLAQRSNWVQSRSQFSAFNVLLMINYFPLKTYMSHSVNNCSNTISWLSYSFSIYFRWQFVRTD